MNFIGRLHSWFIKGDNRTQKTKKNILASAFLKGTDTLIYLLLVPLTLGYLNPYEYGIWLTLNSFLTWINAFDIGLGNGLRNKLGEAIANNDNEKGKAYVSTTFYMLIVLTFVIFCIGYIGINSVDWYKILNADETHVGNLKDVIEVSFLFFCINFIVRFIGNVYQALQLPAVNSLISVVGHFASLVIIYILTKISHGNLFYVAIVFSACPPIVYLICYPITFSKLFPYLAPSFKYFQKELLKDLLSLSILFFIFQIMGIVLFSLSNILISNFFGPDQVTPYNIAYRYFSLLLMVSNLMLAPIWAGATDAYAKQDYDWIRKCIHGYYKVLLIYIGCIIVMVVASPFIYRLWIGDKVNVPMSLSILMGIYIFILIWSLFFSSILNGIGKLRLQTYTIVFQAIIFYPVCYLLANFYGINGIVMGMCFVNIPAAIVNTLQLNIIISKSTTGFLFK